MAFGWKISGLSPLLRRAESSGFVGLALDGLDVGAAIAQETNISRLHRAVNAAERHGEERWAEAVGRRLIELDTAPRSVLPLARLLVRSNRLDDATDLLSTMQQEAANDPQHLLIRAMLDAKRGNLEDAVSEFSAHDDFGALPGPANPAFRTAAEMIEQSPLDHSKAFIEQLLKHCPDALYLHALASRHLLLEGEFDRARTLLQSASSDFASALMADRRRMREDTLALFVHAGWLNEAYEFASAALAEDPTHWSLYATAGDAAKSTFRDEDFSAILDAIPASRRDGADALMIRCKWHCDQHRLGEARACVDRLRRVSASRFLNAQLYLSVMQGEDADVERAYAECERAGLSRFTPALIKALHLYHHGMAPERIDRALRVLQPFSTEARTNAGYWQLYLRCLIGLGRDGEAQKTLKSLLPGIGQSGRLKPFDLYFKARCGANDEARQGWSRYLRDTRHACINARSSYPETVALNYRGADGAILLFAVVYNGAVYLDWFLDHYRALGVEHFFIVDNGSTDGTLDRLLGHDDVSVFSNRGSFARSGFGVLWINHLIQRFGVGHWCFNVDIDEAFVFPGFGDGRTLEDFLFYCGDNGYDAVPALAVDVYPERLDGADADDAFRRDCYFDDDYVVARSELPPYVSAQGGIRQRISGLPLSHHKVPLVRATSELRYIEGSHNVTHAPMADVLAGLLHYKLVGDTRRRTLEAIARGEHFSGAAFYRRFDDTLDACGWQTSLLGAHSHRYERPQDLVAHGLMRTSEAWDGYKTAKRS